MDKGTARARRAKARAQIISTAAGAIIGAVVILLAHKIGQKDGSPDWLKEL